MVRLAPSRGTFCISIDLELAWGTWDKQSPKLLRLIERHERRIVGRLLDTFARHQISATWAMVAQLLEPHRDTAIAPGPATVWYAPDVVERICATRPVQEVGSHSFAHVYYGDVDGARAEADLQAARRVHASHGLPFASFVFPRNDVGHVPLLARHGIRVFRSTHVGLLRRAERIDRRLLRMASFLDKLVPCTPPVVWPRAHPSGIVELPSSLQLLGRQGPRRLIPPASVIAKCRLGLAAAERCRGVFHLWFHPANFYWDEDRQFAVLGAVLADAAARRDRGTLDIRTLGSFAADVPAQQPTAA